MWGASACARSRNFFTVREFAAVIVSFSSEKKSIEGELRNFRMIFV